MNKRERHLLAFYLHSIMQDRDSNVNTLRSTQELVEELNDSELTVKFEDYETIATEERELADRTDRILSASGFDPLYKPKPTEELLNMAKKQAAKELGYQYLLT